MSSITKRMSRMEKGIKDPKRLMLYRYEDPAMGPRLMPNPENMLGYVINSFVSHIIVGFSSVHTRLFTDLA